MRRLKINIKLREQIRIDLIRVGLVLKTTRVAFRFGVKAYIFGECTRCKQGKQATCALGCGAGKFCGPFRSPYTRANFLRVRDPHNTGVDMPTCARQRQTAAYYLRVCVGPSVANAPQE